jgi:RNA polymerase sigma-70 factor (ECF subfamily)
MDQPSVRKVASEAPAALSNGRTYDDAMLIARLCDDDVEAMAQLYDRYGGAAFSLARRILGTSPEAEEVVQDAFLALWRQAPRLDMRRGPLRPYLLTIVHRRAVDAMRRRPAEPQGPLELVENSPSEGPDPFESAWRQEQWVVVAAALRELPPDQLRAVELTYFRGLTVAEMARRESIPQGTAKSRIRLALRRMRRHIGPWWRA